MDPNVRNILFSADLSEYYTKDCILYWYYNKVSMDEEFAFARTDKQVELIDKAVDLSLIYNGKYLQSTVPGDNIGMTYSYDNAESNVRNILSSADLSSVTIHLLIIILRPTPLLRVRVFGI